MKWKQLILRLDPTITTTLKPLTRDEEILLVGEKIRIFLASAPTGRLPLTQLMAVWHLNELDKMNADKQPGET
jgi:hypothetical protein